MGKKKTADILDACCGGKMFYFNKDDERVLFQDIREIETTLCDGREFNVKPDVVGDFRSMEFGNETFSMVIFDPPHLLRNKEESTFESIYIDKDKEPTGWQQIKYGALGNQDWKETIKQGFSECFRVLKPNGFLIFKWNETNIGVSEILKLTPYKPILGHKSGKKSNTHWILFQKNV